MRRDGDTGERRSPAPFEQAGSDGSLTHSAGLTLPPTGSPPEVVIRAEDLRKSYRRGRDLVHALRGVDLEVGRGELMTVLGPSGSGKSTLLHILGGIDRPTAGRVRVDGVDIGAADEEALTEFRRRTVGIVFQFHNLLPILSALENVELPLVALGYRKTPRRELAREALDVVGMSGRLDHRPAELSGGEQQRVAIARAVVARPSLILADEPTGDLDSAAGGAVLDLLERLRGGRALTVIVVTHDPAIHARGERRLVLTDGRIVDETRSPAAVPT